MRRLFPLVCLFALLAAVACPAQEPASALQVLPASLSLSHPRYPHSILVRAAGRDGIPLDLTASAVFLSGDPGVARVDALGWVYPVASGRTHIDVEAAGQTARVEVVVTLPAAPPPVSFRHEVMPIFSQAGCNSGACHGYSLGKNGFRLSLRGQDDHADFESITEEFLGRRILRHRPEASLLVRKPTGDLPHRGGVRIEPGGDFHLLLKRWIAEGAKHDLTSPLELRSLDVLPPKLIAHVSKQHQLQVRARYSDGQVRDVTRLAVYSVAAESIAAVEESGLVTAHLPGQTAVLVRFGKRFAAVPLAVLKESKGFQPAPVPKHLVDRHVVEKLNELHIAPSELCTDEEYLRRVYLDLIGLQPTPSELRAFLDDRRPDRRERVVDALFERSEFVDAWSVKWGDLLQNSQRTLNEDAVKAFHDWIRRAVKTNMPLDDFARAILTARGTPREAPPASFFLISETNEETIERVAQVFCGVRMQCARCHQHPFENWTQADYFGLASFFSQVIPRQDPDTPKDKKARYVDVLLASPYALHPRTQTPQPPRFLGSQQDLDLGGSTDRRLFFADWLTAPDNPFFARNLVNRYWSYFFHRGLIDPVDDLRGTNPPVNAPLLEALVKDFIDHRFDARRLMRTLVTSQTYQRSTHANESNRTGADHFARMIPRRLRAETLIDCLCQATGVPEEYPGYPLGTRANQLPDAVSGKSATEPLSPLLALFGKPQRAEACECERSDDSTMLQALEFINGKTVHDRLAHPEGRLARFARQRRSDDEWIREIYQWTVCRTPTPREREIALEHFRSYEGKQLEAAQDLMWALLNTRDFLFNR
jgi:hypothetical protein